jgi:hypothetical protein
LQALTSTRSFWAQLSGFYNVLHLLELLQFVGDRGT